MKRAIARSIVGVLVVLACVSCLSRDADSAPLLKAGERMVFFGDSITEQRIYTRYVMDYFALRYPGANITFRNAGWSGDRSPGALDRLKRDVLSLKPDVVSICFGMNDGNYHPFEKAAFDTFIKGLSGIVSQLKASGARVVLLTPGCVDPDKNGCYLNVDLNGYNETLALFADGVEDLAEKERLPVYDINKLMLDIQTQAKAEEPKFTMIPDGIHPSPTGHALMAYGLLSALGCISSASGLDIDAAKATVVPDRCTVKNLVVKEDAITFVRTDEALPIYYEAEVARIARFAPFIFDLNAYKLRVTGLKPGTWKLEVQGNEVGNFSADTLAVGIDLADRPGPWKKLAETVSALSSDQENLYFMRWRQIELIGIPDEAASQKESLLKKLDSLIEAKEAARAKAAADRTWKWSLTMQ
ncbi:MAG: SGNH/GDSL hydrolase family protein [Armatimonadota bacterium]